MKKTLCVGGRARVSMEHLNGHLELHKDNPYLAVEKAGDLHHSDPFKVWENIDAICGWNTQTLGDRVDQLHELAMHAKQHNFHKIDQSFIMECRIAAQVCPGGLKGGVTELRSIRKDLDRITPIIVKWYPIVPGSRSAIGYIRTVRSDFTGN